MAYTIIAMLVKGMSVKKYIGIDHHYDFWFDFERFDKKDFKIEWLKYYPNEILDMIKNDKKRCSLVIEVLDIDSVNMNVDSEGLKIRYNIYRYLAKQ